MLFWILLIAFIGTSIWFRHDNFNELAMGLWLVTLIANIISVIVLVFCNVGVNGYVAENKIRYESLVYQYENNIYDNDNDLGKRELMVDIQNWNEDLAKYKVNQKDFWIGAYIPNIYDQLEFIELDKEVKQ